MEAESIPDHKRPEINHIAVVQLSIAMRPFLHLDNVFRPGASVAIAAKVLVQLAMEGEQRYAANG